ncbi:MAG: HAD-IIA family hydrolase [Clostridium sp.]|uniref:HAD-IIA family hydrolase n=1 Tax=Clostridium sp. TaxID=1506 RepID=UPI002FC6C1EE
MINYDEYDIQRLRKIKCFIFDLDGTVYLDNEILDGAIDFLNLLDESNIQFKFFTNNSSKNAKFYRKKIRNMGYDLTDDMMLISNHVIINYIKNNMENKKVFILGNKYLVEDFEESGIQLVNENPDIVVVGFDTSLAYENVSKACDFIRDGSIFFGVNPDLNCPTKSGFIPDCGSICAMITASTGVKPIFFGKPSKHTLDYVINDTGFKEDEIAFIGDRLYTDIAIGEGNDANTILVLSGETNAEDLEFSTIKPDFVFASLMELKNIFCEMKKDK